MAQTLKHTIQENLGGAAHQLGNFGSNSFTLDDVPDLSGKVAVVTGGSQGIGYGCTHTLLKHNISKLYILSMSEEVVNGAKQAIASELGPEFAERTHWIQCDLSNWRQVIDVADKISKDIDRLDILINNAARGIMPYQLADNGVDLHMAINHAGHAVLTSQLLPLLKKTAASQNTVRITNLSSNLHSSVPSETKFESLDELNQDIGPTPQYGRTKLANLLHARWLDRHVTQKGNPKLLINATHPGIVSTKQTTQDIFEPYPLGGYAMAVGMEPFKKDQFEGAVSTMFTATTTEKSGQFVCPPAVAESGSKQSQDEEMADRLMDLTLKLVKEKGKVDDFAFIN